MRGGDSYIEQGLEEAAQTLTTLIDHLVAERWDQLEPALSENVELADELTTEWVRGKREVMAYLRAQGAVTSDNRCEVVDTVARKVGESSTLVTFHLAGDYRFDRDVRHVDLTGCALLEQHDDRFQMSLLHLGQPDRPTGSSASMQELLEAEQEGVTGPAEEEGVLGAAIRSRRRSSEISLRGVAEASGLSPGFLSQVERSLAQPSVESLNSIAAALGTTAASLLGPSGQEYPHNALALVESRGVQLDELGMTLAEVPPSGATSLGAWITSLRPQPPGQTRGLARTALPERIVLVLSGALSFVGAESRTLTAGDVVHLAPGRYAVQPAGNEPVQYLTVQKRSPSS